MHIPDGFIDVSTSAAAGVVAAGGVAVCLRRSAASLDEKQAPLAGLVAAFVFAAQMLNFPVAGGTSGHLIGGTLAAVLVGPWAGALCVTVVLIVQALLFADGGLSALGLNVLNMALVTTAVGYGTFALLRRVLHDRITTAAGIAAAVSVVASAAAFAIEYAIGGTAGVSPRDVFTAMVGVHTLIGVGEGVITGMVVGAVLGVRRDLVYGIAPA